MTQQEWDEKFTEIRLALINDHGVPARQAMLRARPLTAKRHGERPAGPPGHLKLGARLLGGGEAVKTLKKVWNWLNGKKTLLGAILLGVPVVWEALTPILTASGVTEAKVVAVAGVIATVVGLGHKLLKFLGVTSPKG